MAIATDNNHRMDWEILHEDHLPSIQASQLQAASGYAKKLEHLEPSLLVFHEELPGFLEASYRRDRIFRCEFFHDRTLTYLVPSEGKWEERIYSTNAEKEIISERISFFNAIEAAFPAEKEEELITIPDDPWSELEKDSFDKPLNPFNSCVELWEPERAQKEGFLAVSIFQELKKSTVFGSLLNLANYLISQPSAPKLEGTIRDLQHQFSIQVNLRERCPYFTDAEKQTYYTQIFYQQIDHLSLREIPSWLKAHQFMKSYSDLRSAAALLDNPDDPQKIKAIEDLWSICLKEAKGFGKACIKKPEVFFQDKNNRQKVKLEVTVTQNNKKFKLPGYSD